MSDLIQSEKSLLVTLAVLWFIISVFLSFKDNYKEREKDLQSEYLVEWVIEKKLKLVTEKAL